MNSIGTGGVGDIESYLTTRVGLHRRVGMKAFAMDARAILELLDSRHLDEFFYRFHDNASFRFGSQKPVQGKDNIAAYVTAFLNTVQSMRHTVHREMMSDDTVVIVGDATYHMTNGKVATLPFCDTWKISSDYRIVEYCVYSDPTPLA
jgi:ketosteroid isomerase-like protein